MIAHSVRTTLLGTALLAAGLFSCAAAARADTVLNLTVTADVTVMPDELVAQLTAQADAPSAGDAQAQVNAMIAKALEAAKPLQAVTASTTTYSVWHQTEGLAVGDLSWQLSPALAEKSDEQAMAKAIGKLTERARAAAQLLHMQTHGFQRVTIGDGGEPGPRPMMRMMAVAAPVAAPPPSAQADAVTVSATVSGTARLETTGD
jgi:uncharacterized protein YggE